MTNASERPLGQAGPSKRAWSHSREERIRRAQIAGEVAIFEWDLRSNEWQWTPQIAVLFGIDPEQSRASFGDWERSIFPDDVVKLRTAVDAATDSGRYYAEFRVQLVGGNRWLAAKGELFLDEAGQARWLCGVCADITERKGLDARLLALNETLEARLTQLREEARTLEILNKTGIALAAELDLDRLVQTVVEAAVELTGARFGAFFSVVRDERGESLSLHALSGAPREAFATFPMPRNTAVFAATFQGGGIVRSDDIMGDPRYGKNAPHDGMPKGHLPVRSYLAAPVISRSDQVLGGMFFGHPEPAVFTERTERILSGIAAYAAIALDNARLYQTAQREIAARRAAEEKLQQLNQTLELRVAAEVAERQRAEESLRHSQRMESIGKLTGGVAHDFNNLLHVIGGNLELLARHVVGNARAERRVQTAMAGVSRGAKLASQLLSFGRRQPLEPKVVNLGRFIQDMDDILRRALGEGIEIETLIAGGLWNTLIDPANVENALLNLAINARDAMDGQGRLTIEASNAFLDEAYAKTNAEVAPGQYVMFAVTDTGCGIPPEIVDKVFDPFFTTKPEGRGTGLGLSMVYGFVKQSGGHVKIYSEPGNGTTVRLYLPRSSQSEDVLTEIMAGPVAGGRETILVAEDDEAVRETVVAMLSELGYRVVKAKDPERALTILESGVAVDLLFTDVIMPGALKSTELARKAQERQPDIGILFTSGYTENSIVHGARLDKDVALIGKPYTKEALAGKLRHVLAGRAQRKAGANPEGGGVADRTSDGAARGEALRFLVCEDDAFIRMSTVEMLEDLGHQAIEAANAEEALAILAAEKVDILLTDVGLPDMSGGALATRARSQIATLAVIFATGQETVDDVTPGPSVAIISKPYDSAALARVIAPIAQWVAAARAR